MNEKWFELSVDQIEKKLKTNAASGLSRKAARSRVNVAAGEVFIVPKKNPLRLLGELWSDFALILLFFAAVIALFFEEYQTGLTVLLLLLFLLVASFFLYYRSSRTVESLSSFFYPTARVIRGGKLFYVDFRSVVPGDVLLIEAGDILCCDARLVTSDGLRVQMRVNRERYMPLEKKASAFVRAGENRAYEMANMLHAGSIVTEGSGRAIVTAVGKYTYLGAMTGGIVLPVKKGVPETVVSLRKNCSKINMISLLAVLPLSLVSLLFSYNNGGTILLSSAFLTALALAATTMSQLFCTLGTLFYTTWIRRIAMQSNGVVIRSVESLETLADIDYLFMLDGCVLTDGLLHFHSAYVSDGEIRNFDVPNESIKCLAELVSMYHDASTRTLTTGISGAGSYLRGMEEFLSQSKVDRGALRIRCSTISYASGNMTDTPERLDYTDRGERYNLRVSRNSRILEQCRTVLLGNQTQRLSEEGRHELERVLSQGAEEHLSPLIFARATGNEDSLCFVGVLMLREGTDSRWAESLRRLDRCGCKVIAFSKVRTNVPNIPAHLTQSPCVFKHQFAQHNAPLTHGFGRFRTYVGFDDADISVLLRYAREQGKRIALVGFGEQAAELAPLADALITCAPTHTRTSGYLDEEIQTVDRLGQPSALCCPQTVKQNADCLVSRPIGGMGGLSSIASAISQIKNARLHFSAFLRYLICTQIIKILAIAVPMLFGNSILDARHIMLYSGMLDLIALLGSLYEPAIRRDRIRKDYCSARSLRDYFTGDSPMMVATLVSCASLILPELFGAFAVGGHYHEKVEVMFLSLLLLQMCASVLIKYGTVLSSLKNIWKDRFLVLQVLLAFVFSLLCFVWTDFGNLFDIELFPSLAYALLIPVPSILFVAVFVLMTKAPWRDN